jgi:DNA-3-methyladenine glycosylase
MGIDKKLNGADLCGEVLWLEKPAVPSRRPPRIARAERIGVDYAGEWARRPWRFYDRDSRYVSTVSARLRAAIAKD